MRLDGAVELHHGASAAISSIGVRKYCDKWGETHRFGTLISLGKLYNNDDYDRINNVCISSQTIKLQTQTHDQNTVNVTNCQCFATVSQCKTSDQHEAFPRHYDSNSDKFSLKITSIMIFLRLTLKSAMRPAMSKSTLLILGLLSVIVLLPTYVHSEDSDFFAVNSFSMGPEATTPEFDYVSRGQKKFGDKCENTLECGFPGSICDPKKKSCQCTEDLPVTNHIDKCGKEAAVNESCFFNEQCEVKYYQTECRDGRCVCRFEMTPIWDKDGSVECKGRQDKRGPETYIDPAMIGVLVGMALMFIIICVVLRLFSQARWRENRTIFNTPNPRLMNVSLLRDSKLLHGQERRGSRMSVRGPSRQPSIASLRPHSPNPSLGKIGSRSGSHRSASNASATSLRSTRSNSVAPSNMSNSHHERGGSVHHHQQQSLITNVISNPVAESVTVEVIESAK